MAEPGPVELEWFTQVIIIITKLVNMACWAYGLVLLGRHAWRSVRGRFFDVDRYLVALLYGVAADLILYMMRKWPTLFAIGTPPAGSMLVTSIAASGAQSCCWMIGIFTFAQVLVGSSVSRTLLRNNKVPIHQVIRLLLLLSVSMAAFVARNMVGLVAFLLYDLAGRQPWESWEDKDRSKTFDDGYRVAISIYVLLDILLVVVPVLIIRTLSFKRGPTFSRRTILAPWFVACLATLLIVPVEVEHPGRTDAFVSDWFFEIGSFYLWKESVDGLGLVFMLYYSDYLKTILRF